MNVDREDELRIQAPPGAASASESRLQLDGTGGPTPRPRPSRKPGTGGGGLQARGDRRVCHAPALARGSWAMARLLDDVRYRMLTQAADNRNW